jgi:hypothetical protein
MEGAGSHVPHHPHRVSATVRYVGKPAVDETRDFSRTLEDSAGAATLGSVMNSAQTSITDWIPIVRGEFQEMPGLRLTKPQVQRLWGLDARTCEALLDALVGSRFLRVTHDGTYARASTDG